VKKEDILYTNDIESDIDYLVYLKPNAFFEKNYVDDEYLFVTSLTDYIKATFYYNFVGNEDFFLSYDYYIKGTITSNYMSDTNKVIKPICVKEYILLDHKTGETSNSKINITETLNVDINHYNDILDTINDYLLIPLNSSFDISFIIDITGVANGQRIKKEHKMMMSIPLGVRVFDIKVSKSFPNQEIMYKKEPKSLETSYMISIIYIVLMIGIIFVTYYYIKKIIYKEKN